MTPPASADVYCGSERAGTLTRTAQGSTFTYEATFLASGAQGIAFRLPPQVAPFVTQGVNLHPFFAGLLPEGLRLRALVRATKSSEDDLFSLLLRAGPDCVGDVSVVVHGGAVAEAEPQVDVAKPDKTVFRDVLRQSLDYRRGGDASVPGVQAKVSAAMISLPVRGRQRAKRYILKLNPPDLPRLVENEFFFMQMAAACRLPVAKTTLVKDRDGESGLLVERFDRRAVPGSSQPERVHQEDLCQVLDRYPADKYNLDTAELFRALEVCSAPAVERLKLLRQLAFAYLIANGDLHAKNVSVQRTELGVQLTPAYDLLSTLPYGDQTMALPLDGRDKRWRAAFLMAFAERHGVPRPATARMLETLLARVAPWLTRLASIGLSARRTAQLERALRERATALAP